MSTSTPDNEPETTAPPATPPAQTPAPQWALDLKRTIEELPGKLQANVSDEHVSRIAEGVHSLFERSGAFEKPEGGAGGEEESEKPETTPEETERKTSETPPKKASRFAAFAQRFAGEE